MNGHAEGLSGDEAGVTGVVIGSIRGYDGVDSAAAEYSVLRTWVRRGTCNITSVSVCTCSVQGVAPGGC